MRNYNFKKILKIQIHLFRLNQKYFTHI